MIEALGASRLKIIFLVETSCPGYPQSDADESGPPKRVNCDRRPYLILTACIQRRAQHRCLGHGRSNGSLQRLCDFGDASFGLCHGFQRANVFL